jgi:hypothetical protein
LPNLREVSDHGVETAMSTFMKAHGMDASQAKVPASREKRSRADVQCEDVLLEAFRK